jgi:hypothetical protein
MTEGERIGAIEDIKQLKARYFRCVDSGDEALVPTVLADDCVLDYRGCCTDPVTGEDFMPAMNVVLKGRESWVSDAFRKTGVVTVHQGHQCEITITGATTAEGIWSFTDRFFMPPGSPFSRLSGYGHYHETYEKIADEWKLKSTRITRIKVEVS